MKKIFIPLILLFTISVQSQTIMPQVINSAGDHRAIGSSGLTITDNVGETFIQTVGSGNIMITQGFLQPDVISKLGPAVSVIKNDVSCSDKKDGNISVSVSNITSNQQVNYIWSPSTVCPTGNCSSIDSLIAGTYTVVVVITDTTTSAVDSIKPQPVIINDLNGPCKVKIYNAVTYNGDGINDYFIIDNISDFPDNNVIIFNRWGLKVFETNGYDNVTKFWPNKNDAGGLPSSTYFYVINLGNGTPALKGWVELIKN